MQIPIDADHSAMVKFSDNYDPHYIAVRDRLYECVKRAPGIITNRLARCASVWGMYVVFRGLTSYKIQRY
jgi:hypothetical protein